MSFDPRKIEEWVKLAAAPLIAIGTLVVTVWGGISWLQPRLAPLVGVDWAMPIAVFPPIIAAVLLLWGGYRVISKPSRLLRPERFDLRVRGREDLLGRDRDIEDLRSLLEEHSLVFLDGESGSGKSSFVTYGLVPALHDGGTMLPALISDYSGDWDTGLARKADDVIWTTLTSDERSQVEVTSRPALGSVNANTLSDLLDRIAMRLGRMSVLILDQFDDYQLAHRERFLDRRRAWLSARQLVARNRFWHTVEEARRAGKLRLLIVIRSDASVGLHSVRLTDANASRSLLRLEAEWFPRLLGQIMRDDGAGAVIANPENGWRDLQRLLEQDLQQDGAILPQQVRTTFLGLPKLPALTPSHYRRVGGALGVEALYILTSIRSAAAVSGATELEVRNLLLELVESGPQNTVKTRRRSATDLAAAIPDAIRRMKALERLERDEIVRGAPSLSEHVTDWQLDHDYLAHAVLAEERTSDRFTVLLRDGAEAWLQAGSNWRQRIRTLLPLRTQLALVWSRLRSRGRFKYGPYRAYAAISALRIAPTLLLIIAIALGEREWSLRAQASEIIDRLNSDSGVGARSVLMLWETSPAVRSRFLEILLDRPGRLQDIGPDWARAYVSLEPDTAAHLIQRLTARLDRPGVDPATQRALIVALGTAVGLLNEADAKEVALDLRARLDGPGVEPATQRALIDALGVAAGRLNEVAANEVAADLRSWLKRASVDSDTQRFLNVGLIMALGRAVGRLNEADANEVAVDLRTRLKGRGDPATQRALDDALGTAVARLNDADARRVAGALIVQLADTKGNRDATLFAGNALNALRTAVGQISEAATKVVASYLIDLLTDWPARDLTTQLSLADVFGTAVGRLNEAAAKEVAADLRTRLDAPGADPATQQSLIDLLATAGRLLNEADAKEIAAVLRTRLHQEADYSTQRSLIDALGTVAARLGEADAKELATDLRTATVSVSVEWNLMKALEAVVTRLNEADAKEVATDLRTQLDQQGGNPFRQQSLIEALGTVAGRLNETDVKEVETDLRTRLDQPRVDPDIESALIHTLGTALGRAVRRLNEADAKKAVADLCTQLGRPGVDPETRGALIHALEPAVVRLNETDTKEIATDLRARLDRPGVDPFRQHSLIEALGTVAGHLDEADANEVAVDLRTRLHRTGFDPDTQRALIHALGQTAGPRTLGIAVAQREAVRDLLISIAFPLDVSSESPAWPLLEHIANTKFDNITDLITWVHATYHLEPSVARLQTN